MLKKVGVAVGALGLAAGIASAWDTGAGPGWRAGRHIELQRRRRLGLCLRLVEGAALHLFTPGRATPSIMPARFPNSASISAIPKAACWFGRCLRRRPNLAPGALAGSYAGATASATVGVGVGANVLIGGSNRTISLQPVSIEGNTGLNVAAGIGAITLRHVH